MLEKLWYCNKYWIKFGVYKKKILILHAIKNDRGRMPEWSIGAVSKTVVPSGTQGSNPCPSAISALITWYTSNQRKLFKEV